MMRDYVFPMMRANAVYEGQYLLGTSIARPLIAGARSRSRRRSAPIPSPTARPARAMTRSVSSLAVRAQSRHQGDRPLARMGSDQPHQADRVRRGAPDSDPRATSGARRRLPPTRTFSTPRPRARCLRTRGRKCRITSIHAHQQPRGRARHARIYHDRFRAWRSGRRERRKAWGRRRCWKKLSDLAASTSSAVSTWSKIASSA